MRTILFLVAATSLLSCTDESEDLTCNAMGAPDGVAVHFDPPLSGGNYGILLEAEGKAFSCTQTLPTPSCNGRTDLCEGYSPSNCQMPIQGTPINQLSRVAFEGRHQQVRVRVLRDGEPIADTTRTIIYQASEPNGRGCGYQYTSAITIATE